MIENGLAGFSLCLVESDSWTYYVGGERKTILVQVVVRSWRIVRYEVARNFRVS